MAISPAQAAGQPRFGPPEIKIINGKAVRVRDVVVHRINMADVEDPALYIAEPLWQWQQSEAGQWIMQNAIETPFWIHNQDYNTYSIQYVIVARLTEQNETFWRLKWGTK